MIKSFRRLFVIYKGYPLRLILSQVPLAISALCTLGVATLNQRVINEGIIAENPGMILATGIWMAVLALIAGVTMAGTAALAVFCVQGTAHVIRTELYNNTQSFSFANFEQFRT